jgi:Fe-S-cluster-containing hydrogenase component 2
LLCFPVCPDSSIPVAGGKRGDFDFSHCKGCAICAKVCPFGAIDVVDGQDSRPRAGQGGQDVKAVRDTRVGQDSRRGASK